MKRGFIYIIMVTIISAMASCGILSSKEINPKTGHFPSNKNRKATILRALPTNTDTLKMLLVVSDEKFCLKTVKKLRYFNEVISYEDFVNELKSKGLYDKSLDEKGLLDYNKAYKSYRPFTVLYLDSNKQDDDTIYGRMSLFNPKVNKIVFFSRVPVNLNYDGWTEHGTMFPLFNSLLDYLRQLETTKTQVSAWR